MTPDLDGDAPPPTSTATTPTRSPTLAPPIAATNGCGTLNDGGLITVDGLSTHTTLGDAIAASSRGSTVLICDGTYTENATIGHDLTLESLAGNVATVLDGGGAGSVLRVTAGTTRFVGLTLTGGTGDADGPGTTAGYGGAIATQGELTLIDTVVASNVATVTLSGTTSIEANNADRGGGGSLDCGGTVVGGHDADQGGGLAIDGTPVTDCTVSANHATTDGGGLTIRGIGNVVTDTLVTGNDAGEHGAGVVLSAASFATLTDSTVEANTTTSLGGGLFAYAGGTLSGGLFENNTATGLAGGLYLYLGGTVSGATVSGNTARRWRHPRRRRGLPHHPGHAGRRRHERRRGHVPR